MQKTEEIINKSKGMKMELGKFIAKVISEIKENVKDPNKIVGNQIQLDLYVYSDEDKVVVGSGTSSQSVNRIKIPLAIL